MARGEVSPTVQIVETGYAVAAPVEPVVSTGPNWVRCVVPDVSVLTVSLLGHVTAEPVRHRRTNPFGRHSAMGRLRCPMAPPDRMLVSAHLVRRGSIDPDEVLATLALGRRPDGSCWVRYGVDVVELDV